MSSTTTNPTDDSASSSSTFGIHEKAGGGEFGYDTSTWKLICQGAEARIWHIPAWINTTTTGTTGEKPLTPSFAAICKERFPKQYRVPALDSSILKSRTRGEVRCLVRCRRGGVPCPAILGCDYTNTNTHNHHHSQKKNQTLNTGSSMPMPTSMCIFLEYIPGITVRQFLDGMVVDTTSPLVDQGKPNDSESTIMKKRKFGHSERQEHCLRLIASALGTIIGKMHNVGIVHGDLTTSNVMLKNPPLGEGTNTSTTTDTTNIDWIPELVLIDFGLSGVAGSKGVGPEEKAVDLYVMERTLEAAHSHASTILVPEIIKEYKQVCTAGDSVLQRLAAVRLRGRKRECFG